MNCRKCNVELTDDNWYPINKKKHSYICKSCSYQYQKDNKLLIVGTWFWSYSGKQCIKCDVILTENNWYNSCKRYKQYICKKCYNITKKEWISKNEEKYKEICIKSTRKRYLKHKDKILKKNTEWQKSNPSKRKKICTRYRQNNREEINKRGIIWNSKNLREFGYNPLNKSFKECEGHHINKEDVIFIPYEAHISISHNQKRPVTMIAINYIAFFFLVQQNIKKLSKLFKV